MPQPSKNKIKVLLQRQFFSRCRRFRKMFQVGMNCKHIIFCCDNSSYKILCQPQPTALRWERQKVESHGQREKEARGQEGDKAQESNTSQVRV